MDTKLSIDTRQSVQFSQSSRTGFRFFGNRTRFVMLVLVLLCLTSNWSSILAFNFALICHIDNTKNIQPTDDPANSTFFEPERLSTRFNALERSYLTAIVAASALVGNIGVVLWVNHHGIRVIFTIAGLISALSTFLLPTAIKTGLAFSTNFPVIGAFTSRWACHRNNGLFVSTLVAYVQLSPTLTNPISGALCTSTFHWPSVFYFHGAFAIVVFVLFGLFYRNNPKKHPLVSVDEFQTISVGKLTITDKKQIRQIPYIAILKTASVWAVYFGAIANFAAVNMMFLYGPTYASKVLGFQVDHSGFLTALAPLSMFCLKIFAGVSSDRIRCLNETNKLRLFNSISFCGGAAWMCLVAFLPVTRPYISCKTIELTISTLILVLIYDCAAATIGFSTGGFFKAAGLVSKHYSHFVVGNFTFAVSVTMLIVPFMVNIVAPDSTAIQWRWVFLITASVLVVANLLFAILCSSEAAWWTKEQKTSVTAHDAPSKTPLPWSTAH
ncbi:putative inorganic phosphate cotransporter [Aphelenchoides besseyi]|nr:putative inorganic phosphate cotransporter [Aphelenchoides besseyi]KAI6211948.1 putative inorganic phosphate cotransporter [Aphelenchoides besseyi]